jgi:nucleoside-diphosphate kinase
MAWEANGAVEIVRNTMGPTNPANASPGTIRGDLGVDIGRNLVHGSDSPESAQRELSLFFEPEEILDYARSSDPWIIES